MAIIGEDFDEQPFMKCECPHRGLGHFHEVHGIGAKMWRQLNGLAFPPQNASTNLFNPHCAPPKLSFLSTPKGNITGMAARIIKNAMTCSVPAMPKTTP